MRHSNVQQACAKVKNKKYKDVYGLVATTTSPHKRVVFAQGHKLLQQHALGRSQSWSGQGGSARAETPAFDLSSKLDEARFRVQQLEQMLHWQRKMASAVQALHDAAHRDVVFPRGPKLITRDTIDAVQSTYMLPEVFGRAEFNDREQVTMLHTHHCCLVSVVFTCAH